MKLASTIHGKGKPLIILHGLFGMSDNWHTLGKKFSSFFEVHLVDQSNHGRSPHIDEFNYDVLSSQVAQYISDHQLKDVILLGHSMGGKTAMQLAVSQSENISKLIIVDISPRFYPIHHHEIIEGLKKLKLEDLKTRGQADLELSKYISEIGVRQFLLKNLYWKDKDRLAFRFNLEAIANNIENVGQALGENDTYNKKTLFIAGENSSYIKEEDEELIFQHFPQSEIETIPGAGHWLHSEQPNLFFDLVMRFAL